MASVDVGGLSGEGGELEGVSEADGDRTGGKQIGGLPGDQARGAECTIF